MSTWPMTGKGRASVLLLPFTLVHIHIYPKLSFSIKTLHSNPLSCLTGQKERRFWLIPVNCWGFPLRLFVAAFESGVHQLHLLSWVGMGLLLFGFAKSIDLGLIPSRMDFGIQLWWAALASLCWVLIVSVSTKSCFAWSCGYWYWRHSRFSYSFALTEWVIC